TWSTRQALGLSVDLGQHPGQQAGCYRRQAIENDHRVLGAATRKLLLDDGQDGISMIRRRVQSEASGPGGKLAIAWSSCVESFGTLPVPSSIRHTADFDTPSCSACFPMERASSAGTFKVRYTV